LNSKSVLFVYHDLSPGGLTVDIRNMANGLAERGWRVGIATMNVGPDPRHSTGLSDTVRLFAFPWRTATGRALGIAPGIGRFIRDDGWGIVHVVSCLPVHMHFTAMHAAFVAERTVVWTPMVHPSRSLYWDSRWRTSPMRIFDRAAKYACRYAHAVVAATEEEAYAFAGKGCPIIRVIPPGVEASERVSNEDVAAFRAHKGLVNRPVVLLVSARDEWRKGFDFGLAAFREVRRTIPEARLLIIGGGQQEEEGVVVSGRLSDEELTIAFAAADVVLVPSRYEAFSRVVIESWQQERPVVVTDRVGLSTAVASIDNEVVSFGDVRAAAGSVIGLLLDDDLASKLGQRGFELVQRQFLMPHILDETERLYDEAWRGSEPW
jgi:glycosyltransferase involved in cell wall biosynthesis